MANNLKFGIILIGYKNTSGMRRLLKSVSEVDYMDDTNVTLIASVDYSGKSDVVDIVNSFEWTHGQKIVKAHEKNLGLRAHILSCGNYLNEFNLDAVAVLEDDIMVSPLLYSYMKDSVDFYQDDDRIAGISLYKHEVNLLVKRPFTELNDGGDTYFVQHAQSWGQIWLRKRWNEFREWYDARKYETMDRSLIPANVLAWTNSWLKYHIMYCIDCNKYFVFPRVSLTTDFSDAGAHRTKTSTRMQVPFYIGRKTPWDFNSLETTDAVYDAFFENVRICGKIGYRDAVIDLNGAKEYGKNVRYVVTSRILSKRIIKTWGLQLRPAESNLLYDNPGTDIFLYDMNEDAPKVKRQYLKINMYEYDIKGANVLCKETIKHCISRIDQYIIFRFKK